MSAVKIWLTLTENENYDTMNRGEKMAYNELIKNFERIRAYMREFYVYGFKNREQYDSKSARSYDDERRRVESWLGEHMSFRHTADGKNVFITIDSRAVKHNPFFKAWKASSFTDKDITLHFILFDILSSPEISMTLSQITEIIDNEYLSVFEQPMLFDESTIRKKLKEYSEQGLIQMKKQGKKMLYSRAECTDLSDCSDMIDFFSEVLPCGVLGSFLIDKNNSGTSKFSFKHHYITQTLDSDILCSLFCAMREKREALIKVLQQHSKTPTTVRLVPICIFISVQNGRQYLMAYNINFKRIKSYRIDRIISVEPGEVCPKFNSYRDLLQERKKHMWGVDCGNPSGKTEHVEFTVHFDSGEDYILQRLQREKRCGTVELIDEHTCRFSADVYDTREMFPWIRTFICRITSLNFSNKQEEARFRADIDEMYGIYGIGGGEDSDIQ